MNICYINPTNNIRRPIAELTKILSNEGHKITIMYPTSNECPTKNWVANETIKSGKIKLIPIKSWYFAPLRYNIPNIFQLLKQTKKIYKENNKVHIWEYYYLISIIPLIYSLFKKKRRNNTILTTDGFVAYPYRPKEPSWLTPAFILYTHLVAKFLFKIPKYLTIYGTAMIKPAKQLKIKNKKIKILSTGIHLDRFENINDQDIKNLKSEFKIKDETILIYVGMLTQRKRIDKVIKISNKLLEQGYNIKTLIVGDPHGFNPYPKLVNPKFKDKIIFTGGRKDIPQLMKLSNILLLLSEEEGLPGVVMEAMATGLPVIATNVGCIEDLIIDGKEGHLINNKADYNKIPTLIKDKKLQKKFSINAKEKIKQFEWKTVKDKYLKLYE